MRTLNLGIVAVAALAVSAQAAIVIPTGTNPATSLPWANGDQYRLAFITSTNLGVVKTNGSKVGIVCCSRSSVMSALGELVDQHRLIGELAGAEVDQPEGYPGWKPNMKSKVLAITRAKYKKAFGVEAELLAIHAGLECGLLTEKYPDLDIVSFGPNITGAHSPDERVQITSVQKIWKLFGETLKEVAKS